MANDEQLDPVEQVFLHAYPNPNRIGCPGNLVLFAIANNTLPLDHPAREHLAQCSPCYREFKQFQRQIHRRRSMVKTLSAAAALLLAAGLSWTWVALHEGNTTSTARSNSQTGDNRPEPVLPVPPGGSDTTTVAVLNLEGLSRTRGADRQPTQPELQRLPNRPRISLSIYLPRGSDEGSYEVRLLHTPEQIEQPIRTFHGTALIRNGLTVLPVLADFSALEPGTYVLAFRRSDESWQFGRVALEAPASGSH